MGLVCGELLGLGGTRLFSCQGYRLSLKFDRKRKEVRNNRGVVIGDGIGQATALPGLLPEIRCRFFHADFSAPRPVLLDRLGAGPQHHEGGFGYFPPRSAEWASPRA